MKIAGQIETTASSLFRFLHAAAKYDIEHFGRGGIGIALACRYFDPVRDSWVTVAELAPILTLSAAQIRRRLEKLEQQGSVSRIQIDGAHRYSLSDQAADAYLSYLGSEFEGFTVAK